MNEVTVKIANRSLSRRRPALIVAELGSGHGGSLEKGRRLIAAAAAAGADAVKFQCIIAREIVPENVGLIRLPGGATPLYRRFVELEQAPGFYEALKKEAQKHGLIFLCTPFGLESLAQVLKIGVPAIKIASPELNHQPLLRAAAASGLPLFLSAGVARLADIELAAETVKSPLVLLHCVTAYPAPANEYNLNLLRLYRKLFGCPTGVSDHSKEPALVPAIAAGLGGAAVIEKHLTLDQKGDGLDDPISLSAGEFTVMVKQTRRVEALGRELAKKYLGERYGDLTVREIMGSGKKKLADSEAVNYATTRRGLRALTDLAAGTRIGPENSAFLRAEKNLRPGLEPRFFDQIAGRRLKRPVKKGQAINWRDFLD